MGQMAAILQIRRIVGWKFLDDLNETGRRSEWVEPVKSNRSAVIGFGTVQAEQRIGLSL